jgi:hypothetical protein
MAREFTMNKSRNLAVDGIMGVLLILQGAFMERYRLLPRSRADGALQILESTMPDIIISAEPPARPASATYDEAYSFTMDALSAGEMSIWEKALAPYKGKSGLRYLEVGLFEGRSLIWMLKNVLTDPSSSATGIDPFLREYRSRYDLNLKRSGQERQVTTIMGYSQVELRKLPLDSFDIVYVDGSHDANDVLEDAILCLRLLKSGGTLIFDDYQWTGMGKADPPESVPRPGVDIFYALYRDKLKVIHNDYQVIFLKK